MPSEAPLVTAARERGIPVWSEIELGGRLLSTPILGVTGTNGKTTTTALLGEMLGAPVAGSIGRALTELDDGGAGSSASCRASSSRTSTSSGRASRCC